MRLIEMGGTWDVLWGQGARMTKAGHAWVLSGDQKCGSARQDWETSAAEEVLTHGGQGVWPLLKSKLSLRSFMGEALATVSCVERIGKWKR